MRMKPICTDRLSNSSTSLDELRMVPTVRCSTRALSPSPSSLVWNLNAQPQGHFSESANP